MLIEYDCLLSISVVRLTCNHERTVRLRYEAQRQKEDYQTNDSPQIIIILNILVIQIYLVTPLPMR